MTNPEGPPSRRTAPALIAAAATFGTLLSGPALAQPASIAGVAVGSDPGQPMNVTVGVGPAIAPDYEGSDDYELVPFFNLARRQSLPPRNLHPGGRCAPRLELPAARPLATRHRRASSSGSGTMSRTIAWTISRASTHRSCSG